MNLETLRTDYEHDVIRARLLFCINKPSHIELKDRQWSYKFEDLMRNRLAVGYYRYGDNRYPAVHPHIEIIERKLKEFKESGNDELLVDVANICMIEFKYGNHPKKHFKAIDRKD